MITRAPIANGECISGRSGKQDQNINNMRTCSRWQNDLRAREDCSYYIVQMTLNSLGTCRPVEQKFVHLTY